MSTVLITGATDGIGEALARRLVEHGDDVIVHGRSEGKARAAADRTGAAHIAVADLASFAQVRAMVDDVRARFDRLDGVVNNAGIGYGRTAPPAGARTEDGHDPTWQVNVLSGFLVSEGLHAPLAAARGRVVYVSSGLHTSGEVDWEQPDDPRGSDRYAQSKLAQVMLARAQGDRWRPDGVDVNACSPGWIATKMGGPGGGDVERGADTPFLLVTDPGLSGTTGSYFANRRRQRPHPAADDPAACRQLLALVARAVA